MSKKAPKRGPNFGRDIDEIRYTVSSSLRAFIETERRSQKWLAENTGLTCAAINQYLKGTRVPSLDVVGVLMSVTNLSFEQLTGIAENRSSASWQRN